MNDDERLKQTFDKLRAEDARRAPSFESVQKKKRPKLSFLVVAVPLVTVAAVLFLFVRTGEMEASAPASVAAGNKNMESAGEMGAAATAAPAATMALAPKAPPTETAPLDFLLDVSLFHGTPDFDTSFLKGSVR